ncbi:hypothetical protein Tco_1480947 [Tanacetum coccineum]
MAALVISISSDVSVESVDPLFQVDPSESSPPPISVAPMVSPFMCSDDLESDTEIPERHVSHTTSTPEIPTATILPAPSAVVTPSSEFPLAPGIDHEESVRPLPFHHLALRYPLTTSESSAGDSSSVSSAGPSRKRYRSPTDSVTSSIHATRALVPSRVDLLPPRMRFKDSISPEDSVEEDIDTDVLADIEADATAVKVAVDRDVEVGVDAGIGMEVDVGVNVEDEVEDKVESSCHTP